MEERGERAGELRFVMERKNSRAALVGTRLSRSPRFSSTRGPVSVSEHQRCFSRHSGDLRDAPRDRVLSS